jgi:molybdopterin-binding protein
VRDWIRHPRGRLSEAGAWCEVARRRSQPGEETNEAQHSQPGGQTIVAATTRESAEQLELAEGDDVTALIKATEVMIGKSG